MDVGVGVEGAEREGEEEVLSTGEGGVSVDEE